LHQLVIKAASIAILNHINDEAF